MFVTMQKGILFLDDARFGSIPPDQMWCWSLKSLYVAVSSKMYLPFWEAERNSTGDLIGALQNVLSVWFSTHIKISGYLGMFDDTRSIAAGSSEFELGQTIRFDRGSHLCLQNPTTTEINLLSLQVLPPTSLFARPQLRPAISQIAVAEVERALAIGPPFVPDYVSAMFPMVDVMVIDAPGEPIQFQGRTHRFSHYFAVLVDRARRHFPHLPFAGKFHIGMHDVYVGLPNEAAAMLVLSRHADDNGIMIPDGYAMEDYESDSISGDEDLESKLPLAVFSGALTHPSRAELCEHASHHPKQVRAQLHYLEDYNLARRDWPQVDSWIKPKMSFQTQLEYRYLVSLDGHSAAWGRPHWIMSSNSLMLKTASPFKCWYYPALLPGVDFVEMNSPYDTAFTVRRLNHADQKDIQNVTKSANQFVQDYMSRRAHMEYLATVLHLLSKAQGTI